ncbi:hypothetical protein ACGVWS_07795 [Enterobacteriaceae bacterium LUAb1]
MSIATKQKISAVSLALCTALGMGYCGLASAQAVDFQANINVTSDQQCQLETAAKTVTNWDLTWSKTASTSTFAFGTSTADPLYIRVNTAEGSVASCTLNNIKIGTTIGGGSIADQTHTSVFRMPITGGYWRFAPTLARLNLYTDNNFATVATTGTLTITDAQSITHTQGQEPTTPQQNAQTSSTTLAGFANNTAESVTDNYISSDGFVPMAKDGGGIISYTMATPVSIKSAEIGVGVIIAKDPELADGTVNLDIPVDGQVVSLPWTVTVSLS